MNACAARPAASCCAGRRVLAARRARPAAPVRSSVSPARAAGGGDGARRPARRDRRAGARDRADPRGRRIGLDGLQPPGSTFKMITLTGALQAGIANPHTVFPYATYATLDGVKLNNANGEECGGTLELAFAVSCNSVFTPLGVKLGAPRLVATAEASASTTARASPARPRARSRRPSDIQGELDVGSTAIGQGEVLATPLQMATVAATIADGGRRPTPTFARPRRAGADARDERLGRAHRAPADDRRRARGHRYRRGDPRRHGRRQDGHGRTEVRVHRAAPASSNEAGPETSARKAVRAAKAKRATPTPGSPRSRRPCIRASPSACCSSKTARAATPRRRSRARCSKPACKASALPR